MKLSFIFIGVIPIIFLVSCSNTPSNKDIIGIYKSKEYNIIENYLILSSEKTYVKGSKLEIRTDSSFIFSTCGNISNGFWKLKSDTLLLFCLKFNYKNDSLNSVLNTKCSTEPDKFFVNSDGELQRNSYLTGQNLKVLDYLVKSNN